MKMQKLIRNIQTSTNSREALIKDSITKQLSDCVKEIQMYKIGDNLSGDLFKEVESTLCTIIEALFLHGINFSLMHKARRALADVAEQPTPDFWGPLLLISHRQIISQVTTLSQITTEIGQCRAWIRIVLNDFLLSSHFVTMQQNTSMLKSFYKQHAYVRDAEVLDVARKLIEGIEAFYEFKLPVNSSLLNTWPLQSLVLAGIWSPTLRACPIASGVDIAQAIQPKSTANCETASISSAISYSSSTSGLGQIVPFNEDEALRIILAKHASESTTVTNKPQSTITEETSVINTPEKQVAKENPEPEYNLGNSLGQRSGWSFPENANQHSETNENIPNILKSTESSEGAKSTESSYNALIQSYNMLGGSYIRTPDLQEVKQVLKDIDENFKTEPDRSEEVVEDSKPGIENDSTLLSCISNIAREFGLDAQNYECASCKEPFVLVPKPQVCNFTRKYYCDNCMSKKLVPLPARILHNWDFKDYSVSQRAYDYLEEVKDQTTIDLKTVNPYIYTVSPEMSKLQDLRVQLNYLRDYLYTCREPIIQELREKMGGRDYMYEHVHGYSYSDLLNITNGKLMEDLQKVVDFGREHVKHCWLCTQKGFICEICTKPKVLYPFDIYRVFRCNTCHGVYHNTCLNEAKPCPKCERRNKRDELLLLHITVE